MNIILLSGGSGTRLWPLSNEVRSKQFLKIFRNPEGKPESMVQRMYRMIREVDPAAKITIATSQSQVASIRTQLGEGVGISVEPCRRDTFPAIALTSAYLHDILGVGEDEPVVVCPVDPLVELSYFETLKVMSAEASDKGLTLMGITPTYPSEKYGYIIPNEQDGSVAFKEKPTEALAKEYIKAGALWNGGVFAYKLSYLLKKAKELCGSADYKTLYDSYATLTKISFDYAVVEKEPNIKVVKYDGDWKDLGTWNTFTEAMQDPVGGNATLGENCQNVHVINELPTPLVVLGLTDAVVVASPDGILVSDKGASSYLKKYVPNRRPMYEKRTWGESRIIDFQSNGEDLTSQTKEIVVQAGKSRHCQLHRKKTEIWTCLEGEGELALDDKVMEIKRGSVFRIEPGVRHVVRAKTELRILEVQLGESLSDDDVEYVEHEWN
ncbi:MAG: cupin domain-containing protein [Clostridia bacterium]|nr:cupin domain-containing protein [Clostridia bacterium]